MVHYSQKVAKTLELIINSMYNSEKWQFFDNFLVGKSEKDLYSFSFLFILSSLTSYVGFMESHRKIAEPNMLFQNEHFGFLQIITDNPLRIVAPSQPWLLQGVGQISLAGGWKSNRKCQSCKLLTFTYTLCEWKILRKMLKCPCRVHKSGLQKY